MIGLDGNRHGNPGLADVMMIAVAAVHHASHSSEGLPAAREREEDEQHYR